MRLKLATAVLVSAGMLAGTGAYAQDADRDQPKAFVKDSAITTKIKTKLAADHLTSLGKIHVDTDANGVVWLSGSASSQAEVDKAVEVARNTDGVRGVHNRLVVKASD